MGSGKGEGRRIINKSINLFIETTHPQVEAVCDGWDEIIVVEMAQNMFQSWWFLNICNIKVVALKKKKKKLFR